jgi:hypothetical protein
LEGPFPKWETAIFGGLSGGDLGREIDRKQRKILGEKAAEKVCALRVGVVSEPFTTFGINSSSDSLSGIQAAVTVGMTKMAARAEEIFEMKDLRA